jgi:1,4-dihydroxy-2-naphthoate octaprenyltransferase
MMSGTDDARRQTPDARQPSPTSAWLLATRPKTLAAGLVPVVVGTALGATLVPVDWPAAVGCAGGALLIQIGCNFANDAFDALKGADTAERVGPQRAVASGLITPRAMLIATGVALALALAIGIWLATVGGWPILALGVVSLVCAVAYTGGPWPLAYIGLGDLFVFLFFGLFAVLGSAWVQAGHFIRSLLIPYSFQSVWHLGPFDRFAHITTLDEALYVLHMPAWWWLAAAAVGLQATGIIAVNNLRDIATDAAVGKRTLAVRLGDGPTRIYLCLLHGAATACLAACAWHGPWTAGTPWRWLPVAVAGGGGLLLCLGLARAQGATLNRYLARSAALELITGLSLAMVLMLSARHEM